MTAGNRKHPTRPRPVAPIPESDPSVTVAMAVLIVLSGTAGFCLGLIVGLLT